MPMPSRPVFRVSLATVVSVALLSLPSLAQTQSKSGRHAQTNLVSSSADLSLNTVAGADRFYNAGYTGTRAIATVIDAGHIWNGHETLTQVTTFLDASQTSVTDTSKNNSINGLGAYDRHATWVGQTVAGRNNPGGSNYASDPARYKPGIAYGATLWSGATATQWDDANNFEISYTSLINPYYRSLITGVNGRTTDVVNSSFGFVGYDATGTSFYTGAIDGIALQSRRTLVQSAGNSGQGTNKIGAVASGFNTLSVGAVGADTSNPPYNAVTSFSSGGPQDYQNPNPTATPAPDGNGTSPNTPVISGVRARVDIVAAGRDFTLASYGGATGGNAGGSNNLATDQYNTGVGGTSFAAPTVAGGVALMADAARDRYTGTTLDNALDGEVIKAVLLNSADKLDGWNNGQTVSSGVTQTKQALDYVQGAGQLNLDRAFDQYLGGTQDVPGLGGGTVGVSGWDYGRVGKTLFNDYLIDTPLLAGTKFTATLNWFVNVRYGGTEIVLDDTTVSWDNFANLSLELYREDGGVDVLVARSDADYLNTEHFYATLDQSGLYKLRVNYLNNVYDYTATTANPDGATLQNYGLAWFGTPVTSAEMPEPGTIGLLLVGGMPPVFLFLRRRYHHT